MTPSSLSQGSTLDLSQYYHIIDLYYGRLDSPPSLQAAIPVNLLPQELQEDLIKKGLPNSHQKIAKRPILERLKYFNKPFTETPVVIIEQPRKPSDPWTIKRLLRGPTGKLFAVDSTKKFREDFGADIKEVFYHNKPVTVRSSDQKSSLQVKKKSSINIVPIPIGTQPPDVIQRTRAILENFELEIGGLINHFNEEIYPHQTIALMWNLLSHSVLRNYPIEESKRQSLSLSLIENWMNMLMSFMFLERHIRENGMESETVVYVNRTEEQFSKIENLIGDEFDAASRDKFSQILVPLRSIVRHLSTLTSSIEELKYFVKEFGKLHFTPLHQLSKFSLSMLFKPEAHKNSLIFRIVLLKGYFTIPYMINVPFDELKKLPAYCDQITGYIEQDDWLQVYKEIVDLTNRLLMIRDHYKEVSTSSAGTLYSSEMVTSFMTSISANIYAYVGLGLILDFEFLVSNGHLLSVVSKEAKNKMRESYSNMMTQTPPKIKTVLGLWLKQVAAFDESFMAEWKGFYQSWDKLRMIKRKLKSNAPLSEKLEQLNQLINKESYSELTDIYFHITKEMADPVKEWKEQLNQLSQHIEKIQLTLLILLYHPQVPRIAVSDLKQGFSELNQEIINLVKPVTEFMDAFQKLICMGAPSSASSSNSTDAQQWLLTRKARFKVALFSEDPAYFQELERELNPTPTSSKETPFESRQDFATSSSTQPIPLPSQIVASIHEIFSQTKTNKIECNLIQLFNEQGVDYKVEWGKGSHRKLYIEDHGIPIILPLDREWKPALKRGIANDVLEQLKADIGQK
ncbi:MAG: hypothetical protein ACHQUC_01985 [Chlamydiales bacterium]